MPSSTILDGQVIHVKRGRSNGLGFEPAFNSYFDFYLNSKYFGEPLLELEDVTFHLFLRKNLNDKNKSWKMPTIRQMKTRFSISQAKVYAMLDRLEKAHLLNKESGTRVGEVNTRNDYVLSDPIPTLGEFLEIAAEGLFRLSLFPEYVLADDDGACIENRYMDESKTGTCYVPEIDTDQQTLKTKQTLGEQIDPAFEDLRFSIGEKTFDRFMNGAKFMGIEEDVAVIGIVHAYAKDWIENRMANKIKQSLKVEGVRCVVLTEA